MQPGHFGLGCSRQAGAGWIPPNPPAFFCNIKLPVLEQRYGQKTKNTV
jgi:hypothetical protein